MSHAHKMKESQCICTWFWTCVHVWKRSAVFGKDAPYARQPTTTKNCPPRMSIHSQWNKMCRTHNLVVQSQPWSGPGCRMLRKKWRPLRTCLGMRTALRHPWVSWFSGLVSWSWGTPVLAVLLSFFSFLNNTYYSLIIHWLTINMAVHSLQQRGTTLAIW